MVRGQKSLCDIAKRILSFCEKRGLHMGRIFTQQIKYSCDIQSRWKPDENDWQLIPQKFNRIADIWKMKIDLFTSAWNAQIPRFVTWQPQPNAYARNAFSLNWKKLKGYRFPPFSLIHQCATKIIREQATITLVCPIWLSQPWFPVLRL